MALSPLKREPLFRRDSCADQNSYYQTVICNLLEICFPTKFVLRGVRLINHGSQIGSET